MSEKIKYWLNIALDFSEVLNNLVKTTHLLKKTFNKYTPCKVQTYEKLNLV